MISVVIPYKFNHHGEPELRYALRSIVKHLKGYGEIYIIGDLPTWVRNVRHIPTPDIDRQFDRDMWKERNIYEKVRRASYYKFVTDDFYFTNDDHFLLQDFNASTFPLHWASDIEDDMKRKDLYVNTINNTYELIQAGEAPFQNYDTHCPIVYNKRLFRNLEDLDWSKKWGYCIKTAYCGANGLRGEFYPDLKIRGQHSAESIRRAIAGRQYFSTDNNAWGQSLRQVLEELYPEPSKYEK